MIVDGILNLLFSILEPIVSALPTGHLPAGWTTAAGAFGGYIGSIDRIVPIAAPFTFLVGVVLSTIPALIAYRVGVWVFDKIRGA